ncbi:SGNH/GDSL hydrolase family protein [Nocardia cyriacigeorgica]|uniref:SGNH/GDSL hydrolase family protein n=1 Tax=Nocardia cyriacigeorgica TaxID=135487 RepID=UPI0018955DD1|nr:SGNH/GDSL hydrolase family protein [Nocardia cyriacigeorgica]MBF6326609.1 SGNH/GDSL hydrolase family protein [Nocardia cyriacigeorgica]
MTLDSNISALAVRVAEELNGKASLAPQRSLTLPHTNGGLGGTVTASLASATAGSARFVVKLPSTVTRWRFKIRHLDINQTAKTAGTLKKLVVGKHDRATTGAALETGSFVGGAATTIVATDQTIPGDGTWYTSPWVSAAGDVFEKDTEFLVAFGYTFAASTVVQTGAGRAWHWTNSTSATDPTVSGAGATSRFIPFDWIVEYDVTTRNKVTLVIGDSISETTTGSNSAIEPTSLWMGPFPLWAARTGRQIVNLSLAGIALEHFTLAGAIGDYLWDRQGNLATMGIDEVIISAGSNDITTGRTLAQIQGYIDSIRTRLATYGITAPIYMATILARGTTGNTVRLSYNEWISARPTFCTDVIDFDGATRGITATSLVDQYTPDNIHPSRLGCVAMADKLCDVLP